MKFIMLLKKFVQKGNQINGGFLLHINILKVVGNHSVLEFENILAYSAYF